MPTAVETKVHQRFAATGLTRQTLAQQVDLSERVRPLLDTLTALALVRPRRELTQYNRIMRLLKAGWVRETAS